MFIAAIYEGAILLYGNTAYFHHLRFPRCQYTFYALANRYQPKCLRVYLIEGHPHALRHVVMGEEGARTIDAAKEKQIYRVHKESTIEIGVGECEEKLSADDLATCLLTHLARYTLLGGFVHVAESTRKIQCILGGFLGTTADKQFVPFIDNHGYGRGTRIKVIDKAALATLVALLIMFLKGSPTLGTIVKGMKGV
jgi:hypothetical protein